MGYNIAIDGPAGAGKSTLAKALAQRLKFIYVDTGALYRALGLHVLNSGIDVNDEKKVIECCKDVDINIEYDKGIQQVLLNGVNVNDQIRTVEVGNVSSIISAYKDIRQKLLGLQRHLAVKYDVVMDGRDIATRVLPNADIKIFVTADITVRAKRRQQELLQKGIKKSLNMIEDDIKTRDNRDSNRKVDPLVKTAEAILLDTTDLTIEEEVDKIFHIYKEKCRRKDNEEIDE